MIIVGQKICLKKSKKLNVLYYEKSEYANAYVKIAPIVDVVIDAIYINVRSLLLAGAGLAGANYGGIQLVQPAGGQVLTSQQVQARPGQVTADMMAAGLGGAAGEHILLRHVRRPMHALKSRVRMRYGVTK